MARLDKLVFGDDADPRIELRELFSQEGADPLIAARDWALEVLSQAGVEPGDQLRAIKALRAAEPRLSLKPATYLAAQIG